MKSRLIKIKAGQIPKKNARGRVSEQEPAQARQEAAGFTDIAGTEM